MVDARPIKKFCNSHQAAPFANLWETSFGIEYRSDWVFSKHTSEACKASGSEVISFIPRPDNAAVQSNISAIPGFLLCLSKNVYDETFSSYDFSCESWHSKTN